MSRPPVTARRSAAMNRLPPISFACLALVVAIGCSSQPLTPSSGEPSGSPDLSLQPGAWKTISEPAGFALNNDADGHLLFDFPSSGSVNYLYNVHPPREVSGELSVVVQVTTDGPVVFNYMTEPFNTCAAPASARPFIWANRNLWGDNDRWWSNPETFPLTAGSATLTVPLVGSHWSNVNARFGNADPAAKAAFDLALQNVSSLGLTFGGGCFFGHGVYVRGGRAQFALVGYRIQ